MEAGTSSQLLNPPFLSAALAKKTARRAGSAAELVAMLADCVPVPAQREQFVREANSNIAPAHGEQHVPAAAPDQPALAEPALQLADEALARAEKLLARHIGPMAAVIVKRAAKRARNRREFVEGLAAAVDDADERARFEAEAWGTLGG